MREQPLHSGLGITVARSEQRLLAAHLREPHRSQLSHRSFVELRQSRRRRFFVRQLRLARLQPASDVLVQLQDVTLRQNDRDVCTEGRQPTDEKRSCA